MTATAAPTVAPAEVRQPRLPLALDAKRPSDRIRARIYLDGRIPSFCMGVALLVAEHVRHDDLTCSAKLKHQTIGQFAHLKRRALIEVIRKLTKLGIWEIDRKRTYQRYVFRAEWIAQWAPADQAGKPWRDPASQDVRPTAHLEPQDVRPTADQDVRPTADQDVRPTADQDVRPTAHLSGTVRAEPDQGTARSARYARGARESGAEPDTSGTVSARPPRASLPATPAQRGMLAATARDLNAPLTEWAQSDALTVDHAAQLIGRAQPFRDGGHQHAPDRFAEDAGLVRCRCGAVKLANVYFDRLRIYKGTSWWLGCPPTVDTDSTDEPMFEEPAGDDEEPGGEVPTWGKVPPLEPPKAPEHEHAMAGKVDRGDHWVLRCQCGQVSTISKMIGSVASRWGPEPAQPGLELEGDHAADATWKRERAEATAAAVNATRGLRWGPLKGKGNE